MPNNGLHLPILSKRAVLVKIDCDSELERLFALRTHPSWWMVPRSVRVSANTSLRSALKLAGEGQLAEANALAGITLERIAEELAVA
jgi:hypothetical protein